MLIFKKKQESAFSKDEELNFIFNCINFIKEDLEEINPFENDFEIQSFISEIILFGEHYKIRNELNIQKLIYFNLKFRFVLNDKTKYSSILNDVTINEDVRVVNFHKFLLKQEGIID